MDKGFGRVICSGCLGACCLFPMAWLAFGVFDLGSAVTGGALENIGRGLNTYLPVLLPGALGSVLAFLIGGIVGLFSIVLFPMHWMISYRPDEWMFALAMMVPWVLTCFITSYLFAHSPRGGINTSFAIGIFYIITVGGLLTLLTSADPGGVGNVIEGAITGLTDLPPFLAVLLACLEGSAIGAAFGALAGALKYHPTEADIGEKKQKKSKDDFGYDSAAGTTPSGSFGSGASSGSKCPSCGSSVGVGDTFCMECGAQL